jgi:hypothetical protein
MDYFLLDVLRWDVDGRGVAIQFATSFISQLGSTECAVFEANSTSNKQGPTKTLAALWRGRTTSVAFGKAIKEARSSIAAAHDMANAE